MQKTESLPDSSTATAQITGRSAGFVGISSLILWRALALEYKKELMRIVLTREETSEYERIIDHHVPSILTYGALHRRLLKLENDLILTKFHKRGTTDPRFRRGYSDKIKRVVRQIIDIRNLRDKVERRFHRGLLFV